MTGQKMTVAALIETLLSLDQSAEVFVEHLAGRDPITVVVENFEQDSPRVFISVRTGLARGGNQ